MLRTSAAAIVLTIALLCWLSKPPGVIATCELSTTNTSAIEFCRYDPTPELVGTPVRFGEEITTTTGNKRSTPPTSVTFRSTKQAFCRIQLKFGTDTWFDVRPVNGNISVSDYVFSQRYTGGQRFTEGCGGINNNVTQVVTVDNHDGCLARGSGDVTLYLQTSVSIAFTESRVVKDSVGMNGTENSNITVCSTENANVHGNYSRCTLTNFDDGTKMYEGVIRCGVTCLTDCSCVLGNKEIISECPLEGTGFSTMLVYPQSVARLHLGNIGLTELGSESFRSVPTVKKLFLNNNRLAILPVGVFTPLAEVHLLNLSLNSIRVLHPNLFDGLRSLKHLTLDENKIHVLSNGVFNGLGSLEKLDLTNNQITTLHRNVLLPLVNLEVIKLRHNRITEIMPGAMNGMVYMINIDIAFNYITHLSKGALKGLTRLEWLTLQNNNIIGIDPGVFEDTPHLQTLWIYGESNTLLALDDQSFTGLTNDTLVIVDQAATCCFVTEARCEARSPSAAFLTCERLLPEKVLRVAMWILGLCAFLGNILVLYWRYSRKVRENPVQSFLITNLSISDFLMGVYMLIIASADVYFGDNFPPRAAAWRNGFTCKFAGFLAMVSSEASVFFVTLISVDRLLRIKYTFSRFTLQERSSYVTTAILWLFAIAIGIVAIILSIFNSELYEMSEVCIGLPLTRQHVHRYEHVAIGKSKRKIMRLSDSKPGMFFSMAIFLGLNLLCFFIVAVCYLQIFITVMKSSRKSRSKSDKEVKLAIKMAVIVWTDFCCWVPVAILGILVQSGAVEISPVVYAWTVTFILPINSSVNPFLYTITTLTTESLRKRLSNIHSTFTSVWSR